jgi:O-antigen ligase
MAFLIPAAIGVGIGALIISDFYIVNALASLFNESRMFRMVPFEVSLVIFLLVIIATLCTANIPKLNAVIRNREKIFIILLMIGLHTIGLFPGGIDSSDIMLGLFIVLWLFSVFTTERYKIIASPLHYFNLALFFFAVLSIINGGASVIFTMAPLFKAVFMSFLIIDMARRKEWVLFFVKVLFVITFISAVIAIIQEGVYLTKGIVLAQFNTKFVKLIFESTPFGTFLRVPAFTGMHLFLANYLVLSLLIGFNVFLYFMSDMKRRSRIMLLTAMMVMATALVLTFSKTNMLGLAFGVLMSIFIKWRSRLIHFLALIFLVITASYIFGLFDSLYEYCLAQVELLGDIGHRLDLMRRGIEGFIYKHPFIGAGLGSGFEYTQDVKGWGVHNAFIRAADDIGIFGFLVFTSMFIYIFLRLLSTFPMVKDRKEKVLLIILLTGFLAYVINIQFQPDFLSYYNWIFLGLIECTVIVLRRSPAKMKGDAISG